MVGVESGLYEGNSEKGKLEDIYINGEESGGADKGCHTFEEDNGAEKGGKRVKGVKSRPTKRRRFCVDDEDEIIRSIKLANESWEVKKCFGHNTKEGRELQKSVEIQDTSHAGDNGDDSNHQAGTEVVGQSNRSIEGSLKKRLGGRKRKRQRRQTSQKRVGYAACNERKGNIAKGKGSHTLLLEECRNRTALRREGDEVNCSSSSGSFVLKEIGNDVGVGDEYICKYEDERKKGGDDGDDECSGSGDNMEDGKGNVKEIKEEMEEEIERGREAEDYLIDDSYESDFIDDDGTSVTECGGDENNKAASDKGPGSTLFSDGTGAETGPEDKDGDSSSDEETWYTDQNDTCDDDNIINNKNIYIDDEAIEDDDVEFLSSSEGLESDTSPQSPSSLHNYIPLDTSDIYKRSMRVKSESTVYDGDVIIPDVEIDPMQIIDQDDFLHILKYDFIKLGCTVRVESSIRRGTGRIKENLFGNGEEIIGKGAGDNDERIYKKELPSSLSNSDVNKLDDTSKIVHLPEMVNTLLTDLDGSADKIENGGKEEINKLYGDDSKHVENNVGASRTQQGGAEFGHRKVIGVKDEKGGRTEEEKGKEETDEKIIGEKGVNSKENAKRNQEEEEEGNSVIYGFKIIVSPTPSSKAGRKRVGLKNKYVHSVNASKQISD